MPFLESYPSPAAPLLDFPGVGDPEGSFVYARFEADEIFLPAQDGAGRVIFTSETAPNPSQIGLPVPLGNLPRYVSLTWTPPIARTLGSPGFTSFNPGDSIPAAQIAVDELINAAGSDPQLAVAQNAQNFTTDSVASRNRFASVVFRDDAGDQKILNLVLLTAAIIDPDLVDAAGFNPFNNSDGFDLLEAASSLNEGTGDDVSGNIILDALNTLANNLVDPSESNLNNLPEGVQTIFDNASKLALQGQINSSFCASLVRSAADDVFSLLEDDLGPLVTIESPSTSPGPFTTFQNEARVNMSSADATLSSADYDLFFTLPSDVSNNLMYGTLSSGTGSSALFGYIIHKYEVTSAGSIVAAQSLFASPGNIGFLADGAIRYGSRYDYLIRPIYLTYFQGYELDASLAPVPVIVPALVSGDPSPVIRVNCQYAFRPEPPVDFLARWDYMKSGLRLTWSPPITEAAGIILRFQVFRRRSIDDPFEIIKEIKFDPRTPEQVDRYTSIFENVSPDIVEDVKSTSGRYYPKTIFVDTDFKFDSDFIYSICAIDAHGGSSAYCNQIRVRFDRFGNRLIVNQVVPSGSPKPYPNFLLRGGAFVNTIQSSRRNKMSVYFDPEFLEISGRRDPTGSGIPRPLDPHPFLSTKIPSNSDDLSNRYVINIINASLQETDTVEIYINDHRSGAPAP